MIRAALLAAGAVLGFAVAVRARRAAEARRRTDYASGGLPGWSTVQATEFDAPLPMGDFVTARGDVGRLDPESVSARWPVVGPEDDPS